MATQPSPKECFLHVIYHHRYLSVATYGWNRFGPKGNQGEQTRANVLLPEIGPVLQDSLFVHARALIEFYSTSPGRPSEDIRVSWFPGLAPVSSVVAKDMDSYKYPIAVHGLHVTTWADPTFRTTEAKSPRGRTRGRPDWNQEASVVAETVLNALDDVAAGPGAWAGAFRRLHDASTARLSDGSYTWPDELIPEKDLPAFLTRLGL